MSINENEPLTFTEDEADQAAAQEEMERLRAENSHLKGRVVFLRATVNRLSRSTPVHQTTEAGEEEGDAPTEVGEGISPPD